MIPVRLNPSKYSVKEAVNSNAIITLEALEDHPNFAFTVNVLTQDGTATRMPCTVHTLYSSVPECDDVTMMAMATHARVMHLCFFVVLAVM